jgi:hypothetical protein
VNSKRSRINDLRRDTRAVAGDPNRHFLHRNQTDPTYAEPTAWRPAEGEVLLCCAVPAAGGGERIALDL